MCPRKLIIWSRSVAIGVPVLCRERKTRYTECYFLKNNGNHQSGCCLFKTRIWIEKGGKKVCSGYHFPDDNFLSSLKNGFGYEIKTGWEKGK